MPEASHADQSQPLQLRLLGELAVARAGQSLPLPASKRTRALLGYLVASAAPHSRASLCDLLWEGPDDPRAALRWSLTKLRLVVDDPGLQRLRADRERVGFVAERCAVDVQAVGAVLAGGVANAELPALEDAARRLQGEFLDGLDLPACYRFHHWCMAERERWGELRRAVLAELVARLAGEPARAVPHGRAMVAADPLSEAAHATLVRLLAASGRYPDAEQHYAYARELLRRELSLPAGGPLDAAIRGARHALHEAGASAAAEPANAVLPLASEPAHAAPPVAATETIAAAAPPGAAAKAIAAAAPPVAAAKAIAAAAPPVAAAKAIAAAAPPVAAGEAIAAAAQPAVTAAPALVGREAACRWLDQALAARGDEAPLRLHLLTGEPGIGKSRLLDHLAGAAAAASLQLMRGRCFEAEMVRPYGLWLDALRSVRLDGLPPELLHDAAPLTLPRHVAAEPGSREQLFSATAALVGGLAAARPLAIVLDDLQWLDEGSAALLHYLARSLDGTRLLLAGAARAGEFDDNPWAKRLLQSLAREHRLDRHGLGPLDGAEVSQLLSVLAAPLDTADALRQSGGNPLYLLEMAGARRRGDSPGGSLDSLIGERLRALDDDARELLAWAAALGRALRPDLLAAAIGRPEAEVLARLERLEQRGLLRAGADGQFDFVHDLLRESVYRGLSQPRRRSIHRQIGQALAAASGDDPWLHGELVRHAGLAGDPPAAARACIAAGEHCLRVYSNAEAAAVAGQGLAHVERMAPGTQRVRLTIALLRLRVVADSGNRGRATLALASSIEQAIATAEALGLPDEAASGLHILSWLCQQSNDIDGTRHATLAAERMTRKADAATRCRQLANSGRCLLEVESDLPRARALLDEAATLAEALDLRVVELDWGRGLAARIDGDLERAEALVRRAASLARLRDDHWRDYECGVWLAVIAYERGDAEAVLQQAQAMVAVAARLGETSAAFAQALGALAQLRAGHTHRAEGKAELQRHLATLRRIDDKAHLAYALNEAAALALAGGRPGEAVAWAAEALAAAQALRRASGISAALSLLQRAEAASAPAAGDVPTLPPTRPS